MNPVISAIISEFIIYYFENISPYKNYFYCFAFGILVGILGLYFCCKKKYRPNVFKEKIEDFISKYHAIVERFYFYNPLNQKEKTKEYWKNLDNEELVLLQMKEFLSEKNKKLKDNLKEFTRSIIQCFFYSLNVENSEREIKKNLSAITISEYREIIEEEKIKIEKSRQEIVKYLN